MIASNRGRSWFGWFMLAVLISPVLALFVVLAVKELRSASPPALAARAAVVPRPTGRSIVIGDGKFRFPIVGESHYQAEIEALYEGGDEVVAILAPEPENPYDPNAVVVKILDHTVGYLSRDTAPLFIRALASGGFATAACPAIITGGWDRGPRDKGSFGVQLNAALPFTLQAAPVAEVPEERAAATALAPVRAGSTRKTFSVLQATAIVLFIFLVSGIVAVVLVEWNKRPVDAAQGASVPPPPAIPLDPPQSGLTPPTNVPLPVPRPAF